MRQTLGGKQRQRKHFHKHQKKRSQLENEEIEAIERALQEGAPPRCSNLLTLPPAPAEGQQGGSSEAPVSYAAAKRFDELPISEYSKQGLREAKYVTLTAVQRAALPHALCGRDVLGAAKTGSGGRSSGASVRCSVSVATQNNLLGNPRRLHPGRCLRCQCVVGMDAGGCNAPPPWPRRCRQDAGLPAAGGGEAVPGAVEQAGRAGGPGHLAHARACAAGANAPAPAPAPGLCRLHRVLPSPLLPRASCACGPVLSKQRCSAPACPPPIPASDIVSNPSRQIFDELRKVGRRHDFSAGLLIGGKDVKEEQARVQGEARRCRPAEGRQMWRRGEGEDGVLPLPRLRCLRRSLGHSPRAVPQPLLIPPRFHLGVPPWLPSCCSPTHSRRPSTQA